MTVAKEAYRAESFVIAQGDSPNNIRQCDCCGSAYMQRDLEPIFTGRRRFICLECRKLGYMQTGSMLNRHKTRKEREGNK